jgi:hypothetical protein
MHRKGVPTGESGPEQQLAQRNGCRYRGLGDALRWFPSLPEARAVVNAHNRRIESRNSCLWARCEPGEESATAARSKWGLVLACDMHESGCGS